ncbi:MAG: hypothetical protein JXB32_25485 [Deltaproteobacteria bacterium]|nr:hypothetical protein [Deltaproteobacteria bacterium]
MVNRLRNPGRWLRVALWAALLAGAAGCSLILDPPPLADGAAETADGDVGPEAEDAPPVDDGAEVPEAEADVEPDDGADEGGSVGCGNGRVEAGEECDDGNADDTDDCPTSCEWAYCGDGYEWDGHEACDRDLDYPCSLSCGSPGWASCRSDCSGLGRCQGPEIDACNGIDDDCDGTTDEDCVGNDQCSGAVPIALGTTVSGTNVGAADDSEGSCGDGGGADVYHSFTLTDTSDVFLYTEAPDGFDTVLYASAICGEDDLGCEDDVYTTRMRTSALGLRGLEPGIYYVAVDSFDDSSAGDYDLTLLASAAGTPGDDCGSPIPIPEPDGAGGTVSVTGDTCTATNLHATGACGGGYGLELVYYFAVEETRTVTFSTCNAPTLADTVLSVRRRCADVTTELGCHDDMLAECSEHVGASTLTLTLDRGLYFLFVDTGGATTCGAFQVDVDGLR